MKCQNCGKNEVNFHYSSNVNGNVTEAHLCSECAANSGYDADRMLDFGSAFGGLIPIFGTMNGLMPPAWVMPRSSFGRGIFGAYPMAPFSLSAPGAAQCAQSDCTEDCGCGTAAPNAAPAEVDEEMNKRREINIIREQMRCAAEKEDFEKAAELRDQIRRMEAE